MYNVPPKFNQICRLCLTLVEPKDNNKIVGDELIKKLSIFNNDGQSSSSQKSNANVNNNNKNERKSSDKIRDDDQLNKKVKRSNEISISLSGGSANVINNGFNDDETDGNIAERILQCLSIKVSHLKFCFSLFFRNIKFNNLRNRHPNDIEIID